MADKLILRGRDFPLFLQHTFHKHGGRITKLERIAHECAKPTGGHSRDIWFFVGSVEWRDGGKSEGLEIAPWAICHDPDDEEGRAEVDSVLEALNVYLLEHGEWFNDGKTRHEGWYAAVRPEPKRRTVNGRR